QDYIRTARAKGLGEKNVIWKHAFRNSLIPIITLFASVFPLAISGSFVIEIIFSIPGMGKTTLEALVARNYPIVFTVMLLTAILTLIGNLVADVLYAVVDPRISFNKKGS
ncbi:MAG: ABC transporter permease, partial [Bacteroidia bacterium]